MKLFILYLLLTIATDSFSHDSTIIFNHSDYPTILNLAKASKKKVFICFTPDSLTAGSCFLNIEIQLSTYKEFGAICNKYFINTTINPESTEGKKLVNKFNIKNNPSFVFIDTFGNLIHKFSNTYTSKILIEEAKKAIYFTNSFTHLTNLYSNGNRSPKTIYSYVYAKHNAGLFDSVLLFEYLSTQSYEELALQHNLKFIYDFCVVHFNSVIKPHSQYFRFLYDSSELFIRNFGKEYVDVKIVWILIDAINDAAKSKDKKYFQHIIEMLRKYDVGKRYQLKNANGGVNGWLTYTNLVSWNTMEFYSSFGDEQKYQNAIHKYMQDIWNKPGLLNDLAWNHYQISDDTIRLNNAIKCINRAIELKKDANFIDTYASLLCKLKKYPEALQQAKLALKIAQESKIDTTPFVNSIEMIAYKLNNSK